MGIASGLKAIGTLWAKTHPELIPVTKTALEKIVSMAVDSALAKPSTDDVEILTHRQLEQIQWMEPGQIRAAFEGRKIRIATDKETLYRLGWLSEEQIRALKGEEA